jgi:hypothetical protein
MNSRIAAGMANAVEAMVARNTPSSMQHLVCWPPLLENGSVLLEGVVLLQRQNSLQKPLTQQQEQVRRLECLLQQPFGGWETWVEFITRARMCA